MIRYYKGEPTTYLLCYRNGKLVNHGTGINFFYMPQATSIVAVPLGSQDSPFVFHETTRDHQEVTIQGTCTFRLTDPEAIAGRLDYTINPKTGRYKSNDPTRVIDRLVNGIQEHTRGEVSGLSLEDALSTIKDLAGTVRDRVAESPEFAAMGIEIDSLHFTAVKAAPDMQKALEADFRERLHKRADQAIYDRRKAAVDEERKIRESEMETDVELENRRKALVDMQARNAIALAEAEARAEELKLSPYGELPPQALIGLAMKEWASNAGKIDSLSITPDLLSKVVSYVTDTRAA